MIVYGATKAAVRSLARTFTNELKGKGPRVNVLAPGPIQTDGFYASIGHSEEIAKFVGGVVPIGRMGSSSEIAKAAVFLASEDSSFVAGTEFFVDGGVNGVGASLG